MIRWIRKYELAEEELDKLIHAGDLYYDSEREDGGEIKLVGVVKKLLQDNMG